MKNEFCYLNKGSNPYDWNIVPFEKRDNSCYTTISSRVKKY